MSTFKKYLAIIKESNANHEKVTDTPDEIKKLNDEEIIKNFINSKVFIELSNDISAKMFTEIGKNGEIKNTFKTNAETFNVINKHIKENKEIFLNELENKFIEILNTKGKEIIKEYNIKNINFENIEKGKSPNSFSIFLTFVVKGYQKTGTAKIAGNGSGEKEYRGSYQSPKTNIFTGTGNTNPNYRSQPRSEDKIPSKRKEKKKNEGYSREQALNNLQSDANKKLSNSGSFYGGSKKEENAKRESKRIELLRKKNK